MTFEEIRDLQISNIIANSSEFKSLMKQCLSISENSTVKDNEIVMWINAGISDMVRQGINVAGNITDGLIQGCIVMYVKANFGFVDESDKKIAQERYTQTVTNLSLSQQYLLSEVVE